jgi:hypothetical protein
MFMNVDLPAPLGPNNPNIPVPISTETPRNAATGPGYTFANSSTQIMFVISNSFYRGFKRLLRLTRLGFTKIGCKVTAGVIGSRQFSQ